MIGLLCCLMWRCMFQAQLLRYAPRQQPDPSQDFLYNCVYSFSPAPCPPDQSFNQNNGTKLCTSSLSTSIAPNLPSTNQRNDEVAGDESAPLLPNQDPPRPGVVSARAMHIITSSAVSSAVCTLVFLIVIAILMSTLPNGTRLPGQTSEAFGAVVAPVRSCNLLGRI